MNILQAIKALENHAKEEWRIHSELIAEAGTDIKKLAKKHWTDTKNIHRQFLKDLKKSAKDQSQLKKK